MYYANGGLALSGASNIKTNVTYDTKTGKYTVTQKIGDLMYRPPVEMDEEEYRDFIFKQGVKNIGEKELKVTIRFNLSHLFLN